MSPHLFVFVTLAIGPALVTGSPQAPAVTPPTTSRPAPEGAPAAAPASRPKTDATAGTGEAQLPPEVAPELAAWVRQLQSPDVEVRTEALQGLLKSGDPAVIPALVATLDDASATGDRLRQAVVFGIVQVFPSQAAEVFDRLAAGGTTRQRQAAVYGLGFVGDPSQSPPLWSALTDPDPRLRHAAVYALRQPVRGLIRQSTAYCNKHVETPPVAGLSEWRRTCQRLVGLITAGDAAQPTPELLQFMRRIGDGAAAAHLRRHYGDRVQDSPEVVDILRRAGRVNCGWLGRPQLPDVEQIEYVFEMFNLVAESNKTFPVRARPVDIELLRLDDVTLDRGIRWVMPLDDLFLFPAATAPRLVPEAATDPGEVVVEYQIPAGAGLVIGMGSMNITYWEGRAPQPASGRVVFDRKSALPRRETLLAADGSVVATLAFADYALLAPDPAGGDSRQVPRSVQVVIPRTAAGGHHLRFDLQYGVRDGVWAFQEGRTTRITDAGEELLALASLRDFTVHGTKANEGAQPATRPQGTSRPSQPAPDEKPPGEKSPGEESSGEKSGSQ